MQSYTCQRLSVLAQGTLVFVGSTVHSNFFSWKAGKCILRGKEEDLIGVENVSHHVRKRTFCAIDLLPENLTDVWLQLAFALLLQAEFLFSIHGFFISSQHWGLTWSSRTWLHCLQTPSQNSQELPRNCQAGTMFHALSVFIRRGPSIDSIFTIAHSHHIFIIGWVGYSVSQLLFVLFSFVLVTFGSAAYSKFICGESPK